MFRALTWLRSSVPKADNDPRNAQYAGNVLVFGAHPCSGDWFGGLRADDAEAFIAALSEMECAAGAMLLKARSAAEVDLPFWN